MIIYSHFVTMLHFLQIQQLQTSYDALVTAHEGKPIGFFLVYQDGENVGTAPLTEFDKIKDSHKVS